MQVFLDGVECEGAAERAGTGSRDGRDHTRLRLDYECHGDGAYEIRYGVFADGAVVDDHTNVTRYDLGGDAGTFVFDAGHRDLEAGEASLLGTAGRFVALGVEHILLGIDHVLFLVVLLLGAGSLVAVVKLATAFTAAHSVTLALGALGWVSVPPEIVEPLIALSIAYDAASGARLWTATERLGGWQDAAPTAVGRRVFIGSNNRVIARDAATGADLWQHQSPDASWIPQNATPSAPAVVGGTLYMGFPNGRVTALDVASGAVIWSVRLPGRPYLGGVLSPPAVSGETVYVGANNGHLYGLDRATGAERWTFEIGTWVASGPAISGNALLAGAWDGNLYAFAEN